MRLEPWEHAEAAYHEAAHAVTNIVLGIGPFHRIVILREPDALGRFGYVERAPGQAERRLHEPAPDPEPPPPAVVEYANDPEYRSAVSNMLRRYALFCYSGIAAQDCRTVGDWFNGSLLETSTQDRRTLWLEFVRWGRELCEHKLDGGYLRGARRLVDGYWAPIKAVADALLARLGDANAEGSLFEEEVLAIFSATPRTRNPWRECQKWERRARAEVIDEMRREELARGCNGRAEYDLPPHARAGPPSAAPAPLPADGRERSDSRRTDPERASRAPSPRPALAGLHLAAGSVADA